VPCGSDEDFSSFLFELEIRIRPRLFSNESHQTKKGVVVMVGMTGRKSCTFRVDDISQEKKKGKE
jgi:hypothetical protein